MPRYKSTFSAVCFVALLLPGVLKAEDAASKEAAMRAAAMEKSRFTNSEKTLFKQSIRSAKESVARETLDVFYRDALDAYYRSRYDEALELLNNISAVDPYYEDVAQLRETITRIKESRAIDSKRGILDEYMRKGNDARRNGRNVQAITFWKQALAVNPAYKPAQKKIDEVNKEMAQEHYKEGYKNYKAQDYEQAYDNWSNAIALDPSLKQGGLLQMLSKTQNQLQKGQTARLTARASQLYEEKNLEEALQTYKQILSVEPRNETARRMSAKIQLELGQASFKAAQNASGRGQWTEAKRYFDDCVRYGYEVERSQNGLKEIERQQRLAREPKIKKPTGTAEPAEPAEPAPPPKPKPPTNPEEANKHYRLGLAAIRSKDYKHALEELELASQHDPDNEHIYVARERARQEWKASQNAPK